MSRTHSSDNFNSATNRRQTCDDWVTERSSCEKGQVFDRKMAAGLTRAILRKVTQSILHGSSDGYNAPL